MLDPSLFRSDGDVALGAGAGAGIGRAIALTFTVRRSPRQATDTLQAKRPWQWLLAASLFGIVAAMASLCAPARAQSAASAGDDRRVEAVRIEIANPSKDPKVNARVEDAVRSKLALYPGSVYTKSEVDLAVALARRQRDIGDASHRIAFGETGGVIVTVEVTIQDPAKQGAPRGVIPTGRAAAFPVLYDANGVYVTAKMELFALHYGNANAWYANPGLMLAGNPLVVGKPAGRGYSSWIESYVHTGLYGLVPITDRLYAYAGASVMATGSVGQELFTNETRGHVGLEDAYVGLIGGHTDEAGNRYVLNASYGRKRFTLGDAFLIANTAGNGGSRAALQANARWAGDNLSLLTLRYNNTKLEAFRVDPDELPTLDSHTVIHGANLETRLDGGWSLGASVLHVARSTFSYYTPTAVFGRAGLQVYDARFRWQPRPPGQSGPFVVGEAGLERNSRFDMRAYAVTGEAGWIFAEAPWTPTFSYRYAQFSGDDPATPRYERWDQLLSGGNGEQWVQGINDFKVVQNSNLIAHRFQLRLRPAPTVELVPQFWMFRADSRLNIGGNPALSFLGSKDYGKEANLTVKYMPNRNLFVQGHVAVTFPGQAVTQALGRKPPPWTSTMLFVRYAL